MSIQSLSIVVPAVKCINNCRFCVSYMRKEEYKDQLDQNLPFYDLYFDDYIKRLEYARDKDVQVVMLTGNSEPQQNRLFLKDFGLMMKIMDRPFRNIEIQTTGRLLDDNYLRFLRNHVGVNTISLSISNLWSKECNNEIIGSGNDIDIDWLCGEIKKYDFNLRLSCNLTKQFFNGNGVDTPSCESDIVSIIERAKELKANQITLRVMYTSGLKTPQDDWLKENGLDKNNIKFYNNYIRKNYTQIGVLPYGNEIYDVCGMSTIIDGDCMSKQIKEDYKYLTLRPDCHLYSKWDSKASLVF